MELTKELLNSEVYEKEPKVRGMIDMAHQDYLDGKNVDTNKLIEELSEKLSDPKLVRLAKDLEIKVEVGKIFHEARLSNRTHRCMGCNRVWVGPHQRFCGDCLKRFLPPKMPSSKQIQGFIKQEIKSHKRTKRYKDGKLRTGIDKRKRSSRAIAYTGNKKLRTADARRAFAQAISLDNSSSSKCRCTNCGRLAKYLWSPRSKNERLCFKCYGAKYK